MDIPSLFMIPSAVSSGKVHSVFPNSTDADFDFNRDSDATRVNSEGLIERVGYYSAERVTNGGFDTDSNWSEDGGAAAWSISGGKANCVVNASTRYLQQSNALPIVPAGKTFKVVYTISNYVQGALRINLPFTNATEGTDHSAYVNCSVFSHEINTVDNTIGMMVEISPGNSHGTIFQVRDALSWSGLDGNQLTSSSSQWLTFTIHFFTNT